MKKNNEFLFQLGWNLKKFRTENGETIFAYVCKEMVRPRRRSTDPQWIGDQIVSIMNIVNGNTDINIINHQIKIILDCRMWAKEKNNIALVKSFLWMKEILPSCEEARTIIKVENLPPQNYITHEFSADGIVSVKYDGKKVFKEIVPLDCTKATVIGYININSTKTA